MPGESHTEAADGDLRWVRVLGPVIRDGYGKIVQVDADTASSWIGAGYAEPVYYGHS